MTPLAALRSGFVANVLNPRTTLFVVSTFAQVVSPGTPPTSMTFEVPRLLRPEAQIETGAAVPAAG